MGTSVGNPLRSSFLLCSTSLASTYVGYVLSSFFQNNFHLGTSSYVMGSNVNGFFCVDQGFKLFYKWGYVSVHFYAKRFHQCWG
jgi:hypothetical protein